MHNTCILYAHIHTYIDIRKHIYIYIYIYHTLYKCIIQLHTSCVREEKRVTVGKTDDLLEFHDKLHDSNSWNEALTHLLNG